MRALAAALLLAAAPAGADELKVNVPVDGTITAVGALAYVLSETVFKDDLAPSTCRWCEPPGIDESVRDALKWSDTSAANTISNVTGFAVAPLSAFGLVALAAAHDDRLSAWPTDALVILEAAVLAADLNQATKFIVGRERPYAHFGEPEPHISEHDVSFYSGHSSWTFSLAVASGTVASIRGYRLAPVVWASGMTVAATTAYLRIAADKHYFTDVLTGAVLGSAIGFALPYFLHRAGGSEHVGVTAGGIAVRF